MCTRGITLSNNRFSYINSEHMKREKPSMYNSPYVNAQHIGLLNILSKSNKMEHVGRRRYFFVNSLNRLILHHSFCTKFLTSIKFCFNHFINEQLNCTNTTHQL